MSGTEAVMQAVRLARYHTRRTHLVRFAGAYHGWWGDVQPGVGNPIAAARNLYARRDVGDGRCMCCGRGATSPACWSIRCRRCIRTPTRPAIPRWSTARANAHFDRAAYTRMAESAARGLHRAQHRADLRRGVCRLPARRRRRPGIFRRARRHGDLWQEPRRRAPGRRGLRPQGSDAPLPRRSSGRRLLRPRHLQFASLCHDGDGRIPHPAGQPEFPRDL